MSSQEKQEQDRQAHSLHGTPAGPRKEYKAPVLSVLGNIEQLTKGNATSGADVKAVGS